MLSWFCLLRLQYANASAFSIASLPRRTFDDSRIESRMKPPTVRTVLILTLLAAVSGCSRKPDAPPARNAILISIDTLRADHLGCYGYERATSPAIDAFAARGALFRQAVSSSGWTVPAHMTMLTGFDPLVHGAHGYPSPAQPSRQVETVAEILQRNGFDTAAFVGGGYLWPRSGFNRGFAKYSSKGRHFTNNIESARRWVRDLRGERFFLFFHGYDVHRPYEPSEKNARLFAGDYRGGFDTRKLTPEVPRPSDEDLRFVVSQYDAEIRDVDDLLRELLAEWEAMGLLQDTLVVITSDHGDEFYEHGNVYHAHSLYDELLLVPLIFVGPGVAPGVHARQVGLVDVTPTILSALGFAAEAAATDGADLTPTLRGQGEPPERLLFSHLSFSSFPYSIASLRGDDWKLIAWNVAGMSDRKAAQTEKVRRLKLRADHADDFAELFDLRNDPGETRDVSVEQPAIRNRMASTLAARLKTHSHPPRRKGKQPKLSPKDIEDLKALGYM
jgi:arylsulfatase A-like enzyme